MENIVNVNDIMDGHVKQNVTQFLEVLYSKFPNVFCIKDAKAIQHDESVEIEVLTKGQQILGILIDDFIKTMKLSVFYILKQEMGSTFYSILYSRTVDDEMYIVYITSKMYGVVTSVTAQFFDSIDNMYEQLLKDNKQFGQLEGDVIERQPVREMINNFY